MVQRQIIAMGGGGFSEEPDNFLLDRYIFQQTGKDHPKVCFVPTASGDADGYIEKFYNSFKGWSVTPSHLSLFRSIKIDLEKFILEQDVLYVGGGNTRNLLALWKDWRLDHMIRGAYEQGTILCGLSAGSICWFEQGLTDSNPGSLSTLPALGWLKGSHSPHYDSEEERRPAYQRLIGCGTMLPGIAADDGVALHYQDEQLIQIVASTPEKRAYAVAEQKGQVTETELIPRFLGL